MNVCVCVCVCGGGALMGGGAHALLPLPSLKPLPHACSSTSSSCPAMQVADKHGSPRRSVVVRVENSRAAGAGAWRDVGEWKSGESCQMKQGKRGRDA